MNCKRTGRALPLLLTAMLTLSAATFAPVAARADIAGTAGPIGLPNAIAIGTGTEANPTEVGFDGKLWQVIGFDGVGAAIAAADTGVMALLLKNGSDYGAARVNTTLGAGVDYDDPVNGELYQKMLAIYDSAAPGEKALVRMRDIDDTTSSSAPPPGNTTVLAQRFWPLSVVEADAVNNTVRAFTRPGVNNCWLRTQGIGGGGGVAFVQSDGTVNASGDSANYNRNVRPAFHVSLPSVLFTSGAGAAGAPAVSPLAAHTPPSSPLKFTATNSGFSSGFAVAEGMVAAAPGTGVTLNYTGAAVGPDNFIRVKLVNNAAPTQIAYMAVPVSGITATSGSFTLALPSAMPVGSYTAYIWAEGGNAANFTNRGSTPAAIALRVSDRDIITFSIGSAIGIITDSGLDTGSTIVVTVPFGTDVTSLSPTITLSPNATVSPASGAAQNFTAPVTYTVTAQGGGTKEYTVTVSVQPPSVSASATVGNVTISGMVGSALDGGQTATITLTGDTVASALVNADASGWFTGLPDGITVIANAPAGSSTITLTFGGTPTVASFQQFIITIPGNVLAGGNPITVDANPSARFKIMGVPKPSSPLPTTMTGDGFPLGALTALLGVGMIAMACVGIWLRKQRKRG